MAEVPGSVAAAIAAALALILDESPQRLRFQIQEPQARSHTDQWMVFGRYDALRRPPQRPR